VSQQHSYEKFELWLKVSLFAIRGGFTSGKAC